MTKEMHVSFYLYIYTVSIETVKDCVRDLNYVCFLWRFCFLLFYFALIQPYITSLNCFLHDTERLVTET